MVYACRYRLSREGGIEMSGVDDVRCADVRQRPSGTGDLGESVVVRPVLTKGEAKKARILLSQNIEELSDMRVPDFVGKDDGSLRPTLVGAFFEDRMVGAALVGPVGDYTVAFEQNIRVFHPWCDARKASEILLKSVAEVQGLVVDSLHRGKGIGLRLKLYCDVWAAQHDAEFMFSVPTNEAACKMNERAGHIVLGDGVRMVVQVQDRETGFRSPAIAAWQDGSSEHPGWNAFRQVRIADPPSVRVGQWPPVDVIPGTNGLYAMGEDGRVRMVVSWYGWPRPKEC